MIKITNKAIVAKNPTSVYKLLVTFDDGDDINLFFDTTKETEAHQAVYQNYMKRLSDDWNTWCNPETNQIASIFKEHNLDEADKYFEVDKVWSWSNEYPDTMARVEDIKITYFDEHGTEWNTKETK